MTLLDRGVTLVCRKNNEGVMDLAILVKIHQRRISKWNSIPSLDTRTVPLC